MSWEDCGFRPGKVYGPKRCPMGACGDCDGEHHFYASSVYERDEEDGPLPDGIDPMVFFACKHCGTLADAVSEDDEAADEPPGDVPAAPDSDPAGNFEVVRDVPGQTFMWN